MKVLGKNKLPLSANTNITWLRIQITRPTDKQHRLQIQQQRRSTHDYKNSTQTTCDHTECEMQLLRSEDNIWGTGNMLRMMLIVSSRAVDDTDDTPVDRSGQATPTNKRTYASMRTTSNDNVVHCMTAYRALSHACSI